MRSSGPSTVIDPSRPESFELMPVIGSRALNVIVPGACPVTFPRSPSALLTDAIVGSLEVHSTRCV